MKRSQYLVPLSWEHHSALLNASRLQKGLSNQTPESILLEFLRFIWQNDLNPHFKREESIVFSVEDWTHVSGDLRRQVLQEHQSMSTLFEQIASAPEGQKAREWMAAFAQKVIDHVRFEERVLFPEIETAFRKSTLEKIEDELRKAHVPGCVVWSPKFWEDQ